MTHFSFKRHVCLFMSDFIIFCVFSFCAVLPRYPSINLPSQAWSCCAGWAGMMASVSGSMRTLFAAWTLNTQLLHPSLLICYFFPAPSCSSPIVLPRSFDSLSPYSPCWQPVHLLPLCSLIWPHQYASCHRMPVVFCFFIVQPVHSVFVCVRLCVCPPIQTYSWGK